MRTKKTEKIKFIENAKIKKILLKILNVFIVVCIFYNLVYLINTTITKNEYICIFGTSFFNERLTSMEPELRKNDFIIVKEVAEENLKSGDIIAYRVNGHIRINKIFYKENDNGKISYVTKSNQNYYPDIEKIKEEQIVGKMVTRVPILGFFTNLLERRVSSFVVMLILVLKFLYNRYAYKKNRERKRKKKISDF